MLYKSSYDYQIVDADQIPDGHRQTVIDVNGERVTALAGDYLIVDPYVEVVDPESFEDEYEEIDS
jgi:hypothetical protein